jgi:hypothetical protein
MKRFQSVLLPLLLCLVIVAPAVAGSDKEATISLSRTPEPPYCAVPGQSSVHISWNITYATTPLRVKYFLQDPTRLINLEQQIYPGATGVNIARDWAVPAGSVDGKYWVRVEFWSLEAGNEANAEVTFYVCTEMGTICAEKFADTNCNGVLDLGIDQPIPGWWICITTPLGDDYCMQTDANGQACWTGIPLGNYFVYEVPVAGWDPIIGADGYNVTLGGRTPTPPAAYTFLNRNRTDCNHACCLPNGNCVVLLQTECEAQGGTWQTSATCASVACPQPPGACCLPNGSCQFVTAAECQALGGVWNGYGSLCSPNPCPPPTGSCCYPDGSCAVTLQVNCTGLWTMLGVCVPNTCEQPPATGSCCYPNGTCAVTTQANCSGTWTEGGACVPNTCPPPTGSCCYPDGSCAVTLQANCSGVWTMFGVCDPNTCEQPPATGSCCAPDGSCAVTTQAACLAPSIWTAGGVCNPNTCPQPPVTGSCCALDGTCAVTTQADCHAPSIWTEGGVCNPNTCPQPPVYGSCCAPDGTCAVTTQADCHAPSIWTEGGVCSPNTCPQPPVLGACCDTATGACTITTQAACLAPFVWLGPDVPCNAETCTPPTPTERASWGQIKNIYR